jgi:hypothetical protein
MFASISNVVTAWATLAAACATVLLAFFTWRLARQAKAAINQDALMLKAAQEQGEKIGEQAKATKAQADAVEAQAKAASEQLALARQTLELSVAPLLTVGEPVSVPLEEPEGTFGGYTTTRIVEPLNVGLTPISVGLTPGELIATLAVRNIGKGIAIVRPSESHIIGWVSPHATYPEERMQFDHATLLEPIVLPESQVTLFFKVSLSRWNTTFEDITHARNGNPQLYFEVIYGPILAGSELTRVQFHAVRETDDKWRIFEIDYFTPPDAAKPWLPVRLQ